MNTIEYRIHKAALPRMFLLSIAITTFVACESSDDTEPDNEKGTEPTDMDMDTETDTAPPRHLDTDTGFVTEEGIVYPGINWPTIDAEDAGFDLAALERVAEFADETDAHCFVVTQGGAVVGEWYFDDWTPESEGNVFSVTKSVTSLVTGIAQTQGLLDIEQFASEFIAEWVDSESDAVRIRHLLSHTSGLFWEFTSDYMGLALAADKTEFAVRSEQERAPGTYWEYNNSAVQTLDEVLKNALGMPVAEYAHSELFEVIDARSTYATENEDNTLTYSELRASCRDLARIGYLVLREGKWGAQQIVDETYVEAATTSSSELNDDYGYLWWLNTEGHWVEPTIGDDSARREGDGKFLPSVPPHIILAKGFQSQMIVVDNQHDVVFTRIGGLDDPVAAAMGGATWENEEFLDEFISKVLGTLSE